MSSDSSLNSAELKTIQWRLPVSVAGHLSLVGWAIEDVAVGGTTTLISS